MKTIQLNYVQMANKFGRFILSARGAALAFFAGIFTFPMATAYALDANSALTVVKTLLTWGLGFVGAILIIIGIATLGEALADESGGNKKRGIGFIVGGIFFVVAAGFAANGNLIPSAPSFINLLGY